MTQEQRFIFNWLRGERTAMPGGCDADVCLALLRRHKILPVAEEMLDVIPQRKREHWKAALQGWALRSMALMDTVKVVVDELDGEGIPVIVLKGPILSYMLYGKPNGRFYSDIDLVIHSEDLVPAINKLKNAGYDLHSSCEHLGPENWQRHFERKNDIGLVHSEKRIFIELHRGIYVKGILKEHQQGAFLDRLQEVALSNTVFKTLGNEEYFLYLCFHAAKHAYFRLTWLRDVAAFHEQINTNHEKVLALAEALQMDNLLALGLRLADAYFNIGINTAYRDLLDRKRIDYLVRWSQIIINGPARVRFGNALNVFNRRKKTRGMDRVTLKHWLVKALLVVFIRQSFKRRAGYLFYQINKRVLKR
jgi:hypothetical protein